MYGTLLLFSGIIIDIHLSPLAPVLLPPITISLINNKNSSPNIVLLLVDVNICGQNVWPIRQAFSPFATCGYL
jgi:hypothetical protein